MCRVFTNSVADIDDGTFPSILCSIDIFASGSRKAVIMTHFGNPNFGIKEFNIPKALFCSNINAVLQILKATQQEKQYISFVYIPTVINFYMHLIIQS